MNPARAFAILLVTLGLAACGKPAFHATDITGAPFARGFALDDHTGQRRTLADFKGKAVVLFFGYTQCPDVCPIALAQLAAAMKQLGPEAERVQVLFVTVDPDRDTRELLAQYVPAFHPRFLGLSGDTRAIAETAKEFKVLFQKQPGKTPDAYTVDHSAGIFMFDPQGRVRLFARHDHSAENLASDLRILLRG